MSENSETLTLTLEHKAGERVLVSIPITWVNLDNWTANEMVCGIVEALAQKSREWNNAKHGKG